MTHDHGNEFQTRVVRNGGTQVLSGWMNSQEEVIQAVTGLRGSPAEGYWLQVRNVRCLDCLHSDPTILEFPLNLTTLPRGRFY